jgi:hypothetical protein
MPNLRILQFYYDFVDVFVDRRDFQYCAMDTDSACMALSAETLEEVIKLDLRQVYDIEKKNWFPRNDTPEQAAYDKKIPGLFKEEYSGDGIIVLCSKIYFCFGADKFSCKGINKRTNQITKDKYMDVLDLVPTEGSTQWTTRYLPTSRRGVASRTSTRRNVCWRMGVSSTPLEL